MRKQKLLITTIKDNESVFLKLLTNKSTRPGHFPPEFHPIFTEGLIPILLKLFRTIEQKAIFPNSFYNTCIIQILKPNKNPTKVGGWGIQANTLDEPRCKYPQQNIRQLNSTIH